MAPLEDPASVDYSAISPEELVAACIQTGDELAWVEFVRRFHKLIATIVLRTASRWGETSRQIIDELVQETYLKFCDDNYRLLRTFNPTHPNAIYGYIKVLTANLVHDHFKACNSEKRGGSVVAASIDGEDLCPTVARSISAESLIERNVLIQQIDACLQIVSAGPSLERDRKIFWLYYRVGLAASAIAALPTIELSTKGVESTLLRLTRQVRERLGERVQSAAPSKAEGIQPTESL
jgi:RNA polymerase sigma-70 factor, ECF subfamily